jgi:uncharacterized protein (TIGR02145 family)
MVMKPVFFAALINLKPEEMKLSFHFLTPIIVSLMIYCLAVSCEKHETPPDRTELLTSCCWSLTDNCGTAIGDEEYYIITLKKNGQYIESAYGSDNSTGSWSLEDNQKTLVLNQEDYKIITLTQTTLKIQCRTLWCCPITFKALSGVKIFTAGVSDLTPTTAKLHGFARTNSASADFVFEYGSATAYGKTITPTGGNLPSLSSGMFSAVISELSPATVYYYRIKSSGNSGTFYGDGMSFRTFNTLTATDADGNDYPTVTIGSQTWLAKNLKVTKFNNGDAIPLVTDTAEWRKFTTPGYCWYNNDPDLNKDNYGALYNWFSASYGKLCPAGWHVPTDQEMTTLTQYVGSYGGKKLTETGISGWDYSIQNGASNETGFSAKPGGSRAVDGTYGGSYLWCYLWTNTATNQDSAFIRYIDSYSVDRWAMNKKTGLSVRCLKD